MANLNLSEFGEKTFVADADHTFIWDTAASISKRVSRNSWLSGTTADFHLGLADAASPVAQTLSVQSVVAGTTNTAGANFSINGSQGTGTGAGGSLLLRTAPAGSSGTAQNALVTAVAITSAGNVGIGTTAPGAKLQINSPGNSYPTTRVPSLSLRQSNDSSFGFDFIQDDFINGTLYLHRVIAGISIPILAITRGDANVGIGTTSPTSKLHVAGNASPSITVDNTLATGASQLLFKNTVVTGDTDGIFLNGSTQTGFGGAGSLNIKATTGPIAFHTASVTNALSIAQNGTISTAGAITVASGGYYFGNDLIIGAVGVAFTIGSTYYRLQMNGIRLTFNGVTNAFPAIERDGAGVKFVDATGGSTSWIKVPPVAVSALPLAATAGAGARAFVNDASSPTFGSAVTDGGAVLVPVYSTGSAWHVG